MAAYDPLPGEDSKCYSYFCCYRDLEPHDRSYAAVARHFKSDRSKMAKLAKDYCWDERCYEWDYELERKRRRIHLKQVKEMQERQSKLARDMQALAEHELYKLAAKSAREDEPTVFASTMIDLVKVGTKLESLVMGQPTEITEGTSIQQHSIDLEKLSAEQLKLIRQALKAGKK